MRRVRILALALLASCTSVVTGDRVAERGIGGTGITADDRGMGGTGIVGVITGFGSIWVNGIEVEFDAKTPLQVDGRDAPGETLRVGQVAVITATGSGPRLGASSIAVRHEVSGPVDSVEPDGTALHIAGQRVRLTGTVWGDGIPKAGDWVAVSGLVGADGDIVATRFDRRDPGRVIVHGSLSGAAGAPRIGTLALRPGSRLIASLGQQVTVSGHYAGGTLVPDEVSRDALAADPSALFGPSVSRLVVESYASTGQGGLRWGHSQTTAATGALGTLGAEPQRTIIEFERRPDGGLEAVGLRSTAGRTGAVHEVPRNFGDDRDSRSGPGGNPGFSEERDRAGGPNGGEPRGSPDWGGRRSAPGTFDGCSGWGGACGPGGAPGPGHRGRPPGG